MPFFRRNRSQASVPGSVEASSHEHLPHTPAFVPYDSNLQRLSIYNDSSSIDPRHPAHVVHRSYSQRTSSASSLSQPRSTVNLGPPVSPRPASSFDADAAGQSASDQSWPSPNSDASYRSDQEPRKSKRSLFTLHPSSPKDNARLLGRNLSVRKKSHSRPAPQQCEQRANSHPQLSHDRPPAVEDPGPRPESVGEKDRQMQHNSARPSQGKPQYEPNPTSRHPLSPRGHSPFDPPSIQRVNTEPLNGDHFYQQRGESDSFHSQVSFCLPQFQEDITTQHPSFRAHTHTPRLPPDQLSLHRQSPQLDPYGPRPSSQQSLGPPSPIHPPYHHSDAKPQIPSRRQSLQPSTPAQHPGGMTSPERQTGLRQPAESAQQQQQPPPPPPRDSQATGSSSYGQGPGGPPQGSSFKSDASQQSIQEQGRDTPPPQSKIRDDAGEVDVRALQQKYEELQGKYNKVKRYYFDKEAQVQHLQNTVAHQRMAVSRTVLDDNEYTSRFNRLDGAVKEFAFSIRKDWKSIPTWLQAYVNEDAHTVGTKEMTAVGRAVISRWLVDEIFERHFHPGLEPSLSVQLKSIETNIRRQQAKVYTDEDRENVIARISNWRRTTLDGLDDVLQSKAAQDSRSQLIDHLVEKLVASIEMNLKDPPPPGLDNGARTIIENAISIAEKIPLESRDVCVEYFTPGAPVTETFMKVETTLPPLSNPGPNPSLAQEPSSADREKGPAQGGDGQNEDVDMDRDSSSASTAASSPDGSSSQQGRDQRKRSVFGNLISKKGPQPQQEPTQSGKEAKDLEKQENNPSSRIRFAAFMAVEVQGKGPTNVLIKAPVYPIES